MPKVKFLKGCIYAHGKHAQAGDIITIEDSEFKSLKRIGKVELFKEHEDNKMTDMGEPIATNIEAVSETGDASEGTHNIDAVSETDNVSEATENEIVTETEEAVTDNTKKSGDTKSSKKAKGQ